MTNNFAFICSLYIPTSQPYFNNPSNSPFNPSSDGRLSLAETTFPFGSIRINRGIPCIANCFTKSDSQSLSASNCMPTIWLSRTKAAHLFLSAHQINRQPHKIHVSTLICIGHLLEIWKLLFARPTPGRPYIDIDVFPL